MLVSYNLINENATGEGGGIWHA